jgi:hypothetical protein
MSQDLTPLGEALAALTPALRECIDKAAKRKPKTAKGRKT